MVLKHYTRPRNKYIKFTRKWSARSTFYQLNWEEILALAIETSDLELGTPAFLGALQDATTTLWKNTAKADQDDYCHDPSPGGFYRAEGTLYIRIGLPPRVVSGDRLVSSRYGLTARSLHCRHTYPMSRDWGCTSTCYRSFYVPISSMQPWGLYLHSHARPLSW